MGSDPVAFPVYLHAGPLVLHPHFVFETLAYFIGFRVYLYTRNKEKLHPRDAVWVIVGAVLGAAVGSKLLYWLENPAMTLANWNNLIYLLAGKTIVGGLLGGLIGVEWMKSRIGITRSTGDDFVFPLITGCFLTGLDDHTYGVATSLPVGIDFGDGILRHPTQLYEIVFLIALGAALFYIKRLIRDAVRRPPEGTLFRLYMTGYLLFRFGIDFIKPTPHPYAGLNNIQLACLAGLLYYALLFSRRRNQADPIPKGAI
jgi:phosphatidylglycerol:prolipoprotein diacylglycerol transferase